MSAIPPNNSVNCWGWPVSSWKLLIYAISAELGSLLLLLSKNSSLSYFLLYLVAHGLASALLSVVAWTFLPARFREPKGFSLALIWAVMTAYFLWRSRQNRELT